MRCHLTLVKMAIIKKSTNNKCWRGCGKKGPCRHCYWKCKLVKLLWKTVWRFLKETEIVLPYDSGSLPLGIYPPKKQEVSFKKIHAPQHSLFTIAKTCKLFYNIIKFPWWPAWAALLLLHAGGMHMTFKTFQMLLSTSSAVSRATCPGVSEANTCFLGWKSELSSSVQLPNIWE